MNSQFTLEYVNRVWERDILPTLIDYIAIPNKSPHFDAEWEANGYMEEAVQMIADWCKQHGPKDMLLEVVLLPGRTPLLFMDIPGTIDNTVLLYGHLDKQPEMTGWRADLAPWKPILEGDKLYGRGGADDGYAAFASLTAINALREQGIAHARCILIIEACEESGSYDLPFYIDALKDRIGTPDLVICLDSGAGNYEQLWMTTSLRGNVVGALSVETISEGIHSGNGSGIAADSFRVARLLLERLENQETGDIRLAALYPNIPEQRIEQAEACADILGQDLVQAYPFHEGVQPIDDRLAQLVLNRTWRPALTVTGADGLPAIADAGNVLRPITSLKLSLRLAPTTCPEQASKLMKETLESDPPYHAKVRFHLEDAAPGWHAPIMDAWLEKAVDDASHLFYDKPAAYMGEGGTIPFMGMLGDKFPQAQFMIAGVLGPQSNAHGPNEFLHIPMVKRLTACVSYVLHAHYQAHQ